MDDAVVGAEYATVGVDNVAGLGGAGMQALDCSGVIALGHEADVLAVGLAGDGHAQRCGQRAHLRLQEAAEREREAGQLVGCGGEQEVTLVAGVVTGALHDGARGAEATLNVMAGGEGAGTEGGGHIEQFAELEIGVTADAGDGGFAGAIAVDEWLNDAIPETGLVVEDVVGDFKGGGDLAGVVDILAGAAAAGTAGCRAVIIELHGDADHVVAGVLQECRRDGAVDAAGHGSHDAGAGREGGHGDADATDRLGQQWCRGKRSGWRRGVRLAIDRCAVLSHGEATSSEWDRLDAGGSCARVAWARAWRSHGTRAVNLPVTARRAGRNLFTLTHTIAPKDFCIAAAG